MPIKYTLPKNAQELDNLINSAVKAAGTMRTKIQQAAVAVLHHAYQHGDYTKANELVEGLGHGVKRDSLVEFFVKFGGLTINEEGNAFGGWKGKDYIKACFDDAKATMWYDLKKANPFKGFNLEQEITKLLKRKAKIEKDMEGMTEQDKELVSLNVNDATMQALLNAVNYDAMIVVEEEPANQDEALIEHLEADLAAGQEVA